MMPTLAEYEAILARLAALEQLTLELQAQVQERDQENQVLREELEEWRQGTRTRPPRQRRDPGNDDSQQTPRRKRRRGRKKGHRGAGRRRPPTTERIVRCTLDACPDCAGELKDIGIAGQRHVEDIVVQVQTTCYQRRKYQCLRCDKTQRAQLPPELGGAPRIGPNAQALATWLRWQGRMTVGQISRFFQTVGLRWSPGGLTQMFERNIDKLAPTVRQLWGDLLDETVLHVDETGWKEDGQRHWLHVALGAKTSCFLLSPNRDRVSFETLVPTDWSGICVTDGWSAYEALPPERHAGCWAHVLRKIRDVCEVHQRPGDQECLSLVKSFWKEAAAYREQWSESRGPPRSARCALLGRFEQLVWSCLGAESEKLHKVGRWLDRKRSRYLLFLDRVEVPLENNAAERSLRPAVIVRKTSYGTRSEAGSNTFADWMTLAATLKQRGGCLLEFLPRAFTELAARRTPRLLLLEPA